MTSSILEEVGKCYHTMTIKIRERHQWLDNSVLFPTTESYVDLLMYMLAMVRDNERLYNPSAQEWSLSSKHPLIHIARQIRMQSQTYGVLNFSLYNGQSILVHERRAQTQLQPARESMDRPGQCDINLQGAKITIITSHGRVSVPILSVLD